MASVCALNRIPERYVKKLGNRLDRCVSEALRCAVIKEIKGIAAVSNAPRLLTPAEVCEQLNISLKTMHVFIRRGDLKAVKLGPRSTRVYADSVQTLIENGAKDA